MEYLQAKLIMAKRISFFLFLTVIVIGTIVALAVWKWDVLVERISEEKVTAERHAWMERTRELEGIIIEMQKGTEPKPLRPAERLRQAARALGANTAGSEVAVARGTVRSQTVAGLFLQACRVSGRHLSGFDGCGRQPIRCGRCVS